MKRTKKISASRRAVTWHIAAALLIAGVAANAAASSTEDATQKANGRFWSALHDADYGSYPAALAAVEAALAESPEDPVQNAHRGWLHMWHLAEAGNFQVAPQQRSADLTAAGQEFEQAVRLEPEEARYLGFYAVTRYLESTLSADAAGSRRAEATMDRAVRMWPEFNLFTAGYIHSTDPYDSPAYATALRRMWKNIDVCIGGRVSRQHPDFAQYLRRETTVGPKRACWNSSIAPHNLEGFFLNFGDMLVKQGNVVLAQKMYANARLSSAYTDWPYRNVLERRIADAAANVAIFRNPSSASGSAMMVQSDFSCMACHRR